MKPLANTNYFLTKNSCDKIMIRGGKSEVVEGTGRTRVIEFKDYATALECYHSPEYAKAIEIRKGSSAVTDIIIAGITVRSQRTGKSMPRTLGCCCAAQWILGIAVDYGA